MTALVPIPTLAAPPAVTSVRAIPPAVAECGPAASFAWDTFFSGVIRNRHTRAAYHRAVTRFLTWLSPQGIALPQVTPGMIGAYLDGLTLAVPTKKLELAALRGFFAELCLRHIVVLNPAASVRGGRYEAVEGLTPEITTAQARTLLDSIATDTLLGLRDKAVIGCLIFTAARAGAVAGLTRGGLTHDGTQHVLRFAEKGGKRREIPVRHDLERDLLAYLEAAGLTAASASSPLFRTAAGRLGRLTGRGMTGVDVCRVVKRRLAAAGLPVRLSPHSFRVCTITDLLTQGIPLADVQYLAGHADPRTTRLYDRRDRRVTRNVVERISV